MQLARLAALSLAFALPLTAWAQPAPGPAAAPTPAQATPQGGPINLELNKLESLPAAQGGAPSCRVYMVANNPDGPAIDALRLDLVIFSTDGVISRRVAVDLGPLPPRKTSVRLFDLTGQACDQIGRMLVNDVMQCQVPGASGTPDQQREACLLRIRTSSLAKAQLTK